MTNGEKFLATFKDCEFDEELMLSVSVEMPDGSLTWFPTWWWNDECEGEEAKCES